MISTHICTRYFIVMSIMSLAAASPIVAEGLAGLRPPSVAQEAESVTEALRIAVQYTKRETKTQSSSILGLSFSGLFPNTPSSSSAPANLTDDEAWGLRLHNEERKYVGISQMLDWDYNLEAEALAYAKQLAFWGILQYPSAASKRTPGENLAYIKPIIPVLIRVAHPIEAATDKWQGSRPIVEARYSNAGRLFEAPYYHGEVIPQGAFQNYSHYTQAMWNTTTKVGIAAAIDLLGGYYVVARYSPPGNINGQKPY